VLSVNTAEVDGVLAKFQATALEQAYSKLVRALALDVFRRIVYMTPRYTGRAQASWDLTMLEPSSFVPPEGAERYSRENFTAAVTALASLKLGDSVWITSNLVYIRRLNDGSSDQAPAQFVEQAVMEAVSVLNGRRPK
jgi:hypothetical protein